MRLLDDTVRQLFFDINIEGDSSSISLGEEVATYCNTELINTIEKQLSVYQNRSHTTIDILEIDLGSVSSNEWKSLLKNKLNESLHEQIKITLKSKDFETVSPDTTEFLANKTFNEKVLKQIKKHPKHIKKFNENKLEDSSSENHNLNNLIENAFFFYLEKGYLPWWYSINTTSTIIKEYLNQHTQKNRVTLLFILQNNQKALQRFISVTNNEKINSFSNLIRVSKKFTEVNLSIYKALSKTIAPTLKEKEFQIAYREILILKNDDLFQGAKKAKIFFLESLLKHENIQQRLNALDKKIIELKIESFLKKIQTIWPNLDLKNIIKLFKNLSVKNNQQNSKHTTKPKGSIENIIKPIKETGNEEKAQKTENNLPSKESKLKNQTKSIEAEEKEGVYVQYSGIILLHPFLPSFFTKLNLLENGQWKNEESSKKAVQLLAYLSTGAMECPEYELLLFKHLCGVSWDTLIEAELELSSDEIKEADSLLQSVLEHWTALKNTSINGLREGFIERDGKLWKEQNNWQLHIEQKGQDILLQQLPWGIGMLKFSWLKELIIITWI